MQLQFLNNMLIGQKLRWAFGVVVLAIAFSTLLNFYLLNGIKGRQQQLVQVRFPIELEGKNLINGMNQSLAALRGYMILGKEPVAAAKFKAERQSAWDNIERSVTYLHSISDSMDQSSIQTISQIKSALPTIQENQQAVEDIAQSPENQPALELLMKDAGPKAALMLEHMGKVIDIEGGLEADAERKTLLKYLADSRGAFAISVGSLRAYLITGESSFKDQFDINWQINTDAYLEIDESIDMLTEEQQQYWRLYEGLREQFAPVSIEMFRLRLSEKWNIANHMLENDVEPKIRDISALLQTMASMQQQQVVADVEELEQGLSLVFVFMLVAMLVAITIGIITGMSMSSSISRTMKILVTHADEIANGQLAFHHDDVKNNRSKDEMGTLARSFSAMSYSLSNMISTVKGHAIQMRMATYQVASLSEEILTACQQEEDRSGEVNKATQMLLDASENNLSFATTAAEIVYNAREQALTGVAVVAATIVEMELSVNEVKQTSIEIAALDEASQRIYAITDTIHQIADQTNLLALNAAIEAARAGEHGRGFAVVADEVRNLAIKTSAATVEISDLIKVLKQKVEHSIEAMNRAADYVYSSQKKASEASTAISSIGDSIGLITESSVEICDGAVQQMQQLGLLQDKLDRLFETLREDGSRAGAVSIIARVLHGVTEDINGSLNRFDTLPYQRSSEDLANERRSEQRLEGCLRIEIAQGEHTYEGVTRNVANNHLGVELSTKLDLSMAVTMTIFLPNLNFIDYKNQMPLLLSGKLIRENRDGQIYQYAIDVHFADVADRERLLSGFYFFENI